MEVVELQGMTSTRLSVSTVDFAKRHVLLMQLLKDPTSNLPPRLMRSCCTTKRSCLGMVTDGKLRLQRISDLKAFIADVVSLFSVSLLRQQLLAFIVAEKKKMIYAWFCRIYNLYFVHCEFVAELLCFCYI